MANILGGREDMRRIFCTAVVFALFCSVRFLPEANAIDYTYTWAAEVTGNSGGKKHQVAVKEAFLNKIHQSGWSSENKTIPKIDEVEIFYEKRCENSDCKTYPKGWRYFGYLKIKTYCGLQKPRQEFSRQYKSEYEFGEARFKILAEKVAEDFLEKFGKPAQVMSKR